MIQFIKPKEPNGYISYKTNRVIDKVDAVLPKEYVDNNPLLKRRKYDTTYIFALRLLHNNQESERWVKPTYFYYKETNKVYHIYGTIHK